MRNLRESLISSLHRGICATLMSYLELKKNLFTYIHSIYSILSISDIYIYIYMQPYLYHTSQEEEEEEEEGEEEEKAKVEAQENEWDE